MTFPANPILEAAPYGPQPVLPAIGPQGGPYTVRGPLWQTLLPQAARTTSVVTALQQNYGYRGAYLFLGVVANPGGAQTLSLTVTAVEPVGSNAPPILVVPASATPGGLYLLYPGIAGAVVEGVAQARNLPLPPTWQVTVAHSGAGSWTYYLAAGLLP